MKSVKHVFSNAKYCMIIFASVLPQALVTHLICSFHMSYICKLKHLCVIIHPPCPEMNHSTLNNKGSLLALHLSITQKVFYGRKRFLHF